MLNAYIMQRGHLFGTPFVFFLDPLAVRDVDQDHQMLALVQALEIGMN
jgi:hypothetical protein